MQQESCPEWLKPIFNQRFNELAKKAGEHHQVQPLNQKQDEIMKQLKGELP